MIKSTRLMSSTATDTIELLSDDEGKALLDEAARRYLGMSGVDFLMAWDSGRFKDDPDRPEVMRVAMLIPLGR